MMKHNVLAALLLAAATLLAVGCDKDNDNTSSTPQAKVSRVYRSSSLLTESYNNATGTWDTVMYHSGERLVYLELYWDGDRIDSTYGLSVGFALRYDDEGRLSEIEGYGTNAAMTTVGYDADGHLAHVQILNVDNGDTLYDEVEDYQWGGGRMERIESNILKIAGNPQGIQQEVRRFAWKGDNIATSVYQCRLFNGLYDTITYNYEYSDVPNPLYGITYWQMLRRNRTLFNNYDPTEGLCRNMPSRIYNDGLERTYEYTTSAGRVTAIHEVFSSTDAAGTHRQTTILDYEIEYVE